MSVNQASLEKTVISPSDEASCSLDIVRSHLAIVGAREGVWDWDLQTGSAWCSEQWAQVLGYRQDEIPDTAVAWAELCHPDDLRAVQAALTAHFKGEQPYYDSEHRLRTRSGDWIWVQARGQVLRRSPEGRALRCVGTFSDISLRKGSEFSARFLLALNDRLKLIGDPLAMIDAASAALGRHLGVSRVGFAEIDIANNHFAIDREWRAGDASPMTGRWPLNRFGGVFLDALAEGHTVTVEDVQADARTQQARVAAAYARVKVRAFVDVPLVRGGQLIAMLYVHHAQPRRWTSVELATIRAVCERLWDAVEHGRTLAALHASEERLEQAMTAAGFGAWDWSAQTGEFQVSASFRPVLGAAMAQIRTWKDMDALVHPDDRAAVHAASNSLWSGRAGDRFDLEFRSRPGSDAPRWLVTRGAVTERSPDGRPLRMRGIMADITERKAMEAELRAAQDISTQASRLSAMGALASTIAHELNQPLASATNYLTVSSLMMARGPDARPDEIMASIDGAAASIGRASEIIRRMRRFTLSGEVSRVPVSLRTIIGRAWETLRARAEAEGVQLVRDLDEALDTVECDPIQIEQVLANLMKNALDAMADSAVRRLTLVSRVAGRELRVGVADSGPGLPPDVAANLFEPFRTTKANGTGLGLPICRTMIEAHGGRIWVEDAPGGGVQFVFTLPLDRD